MTHPYTYTIVRKDIGLHQQMAQSGHSALEAGIRFGNKDQISSMIILQVANEAELMKASEHLQMHGIEHYMFWEPDFGPMGYTSLTTCPMTEKSERNIFRKWKLWRAE